MAKDFIAITCFLSRKKVSKFQTSNVKHKYRISNMKPEVYGLRFSNEFVCESFTGIYEKGVGMFSKICIKHILFSKEQ